MPLFCNPFLWNWKVFPIGILFLAFSSYTYSQGSGNLAILSRGNKTMDLVYATDNTTLNKSPSVVCIGSSTFAGVGSSNPATTSAVALISSWLKTNTGGSVVQNLSVGGYTTNDLIPGNGNTSHNVEAAANLNPSFVLVSIPTNDAPINTTTQWLNNLITLDNYLKARGIVLIVEGTQPRNTFTASQDQALADMNVIIGNYFGNRFVNVLNLLRDLGSPSPAVINPIYNAGDGIHPNDLGHQIIANQFISVMKSYFVPNTNTSWNIQVSADGSNFTDFSNQPVNVLKINIPLDSRYYRFKAVYANGTFSAYSNIAQYLGFAPSITYINFGDSFSLAPSPWNNTGYKVSTGSNFTLRDQIGLPTGVMTLLSNFNAPSTGLSTGNNTGIYPDAVLQSSFSYGSSDSAKIQISGLNPANQYNFTFFSSWSNPWSGGITYYGIGSTNMPLDASNNTSKTVSIQGISPNSNGTIILRMARDNKNFSSALINALVITAITKPIIPPPPPPTSITYVNFGDSYSTAPAPWNNTGYKVSTGSSFSLKDGNGSGSATMTLLSNFNAPNTGVVTGNNSGIYPDIVSQSAFSYSNTDSAKIQFSGLNPGNLYNFTFFSSWSNPWSGGITYYGIGSTNVSLDASNNSTKTVTIHSIAPNPQGVITLRMSRDGKNFSSAILNALVFESYVNPIYVPNLPAPPTLLTAHGISNSGIKLNWVTAPNALWYYIYKSSTSTGPFQLIDSVSGNLNTYTQSGLSLGLGNYYQLKSKNQNGVSIPGNSAYGSTFSYTVDIQFNADQPAGSPWNSFNAPPINGLGITNLLTTQGSNSGLSITITHNFDGYNVLGNATGNNSGIYPDNVLRGQFYIQSPDSAIIQLSGLSPATGYDLVFFNSWKNPFSTGTTNFTVNGSTVSLNSANNTSNTAQINNLVSNSLGQLNITIKCANASTFGIISAMVLQAHPIITSSPKVSISSFKKVPLAIVPNYIGFSEESSVYPIPFGDFLNVRFYAHETGKFAVSIYDLLGNRLYSEPLQTLIQGVNEKSIHGNLSNFLPGLYVLKIESSVLPVKTFLINKF